MTNLPPAPAYLPGVTEWPVLSPEETVAILLQHPNREAALDALLTDLYDVRREQREKAARLRGGMRG